MEIQEARPETATRSTGDFTGVSFSPAEAASRVKARSAELRRAFEASGDAAALLAGRTSLVDSIVCDSFQWFLAASFPTGLAMMAVGGYGRRELFPFSDVDLLVLVEGAPPSGPEKEALASFLQCLWDAGLRLGHSVHTVDECCELHEQNLELNVSLLDQRFLAGDRDLAAKLDRGLPRFLQSQRQALARRLCKLTHQRHAKFHDTIFHLEPNIKEGPGCLRDWQLIGWVDKLMGTPTGRPELERAARFLFSIRAFLHYRAGRDNNVLTFDAQEEIADAPYLPFEEPSHSMREFFRNSRLIHRAALRTMESFEEKGNSLLASFRDWRSRLSNAEFTVARDRILFKTPQLLEQDPAGALRLFKMVARHALDLHTESERKLAEHMPAIRAWCAAGKGVWPALREILDSPHAARAIRAMHQTGVLTALFPEWETIDCYVVRDFHHRYTVDEHTIIALENLEGLNPSGEPSRGKFAGLIAEVQDLPVLRFALLFHDVGKGGEGEGHSRESARLAAEAAQRIGMPEQDRLTACRLIEQHLVFSGVMTGRDLDDPSTARWIADRVGTVETLKKLTLLTYADVAAVNPTALSPWRLEQLWRVYLTAHRELTIELATDRILAATQGGPEAESFIKGFPVRYLRIHSDQEIREHLALEDRRRSVGVAVDLRKSGSDYQIVVLATDRHFLFASIAGTLASFGLNILKAEAFANQQGNVLDTFAFSDPKRNLELNPSEADRLLQSLERVALGKLDVKALLRTRPVPSAPSRRGGIEPRVTFDSEASSSATLAEVIAQDRPGLLYDLATTFSDEGCSIDVVLVDTEAHKAIDVFYVTKRGQKLDIEEHNRLRQRLLAVLAN